MRTQTIVNHHMRRSRLAKAGSFWQDSDPNRLLKLDGAAKAAWVDAGDLADSVSSTTW